MSIAVAGAGAFGTALAVALARAGREVTLWARDAAAVEAMQAERTAPRLAGVTLPEGIRPTGDADALAQAQSVLLAVPAQATRGFLQQNRARLAGKALVACAKGIELASLTGQTALIAEEMPDAVPALLTGPSFAADIARGLPTALTLACREAEIGQALQHALSTPELRLYTTTDCTGAELGGALKNVIAIACGACLGAGYGRSAHAALMTRGFAEITRLASALGARPETLAGLSGFGDLVLTCSSEQSRNMAMGLALGRGEDWDPAITVEGAATAGAAVRLAERLGLELPVSTVVARMVAREMTAPEALRALLDRPLKEE
ncbi:NAD(P)H-dependent glycerol-3-phosphate dehydrogenase [Pseudoroseicyclus aestuarii]|uniref:Glycerol-3-phosphate dehydrogenase [NAD(P)+] n=1 Tax=Pseudoroseicyclus aestuarii TaxID=1795041 RepID=A0A318T8A7_9RHOB|nr:NAD(P)H-dependent glycerol-3-phosphate dehydrogenase [Pseudoroseicyclus aestuarii]PYE84618.1 glycerol-3-phosphate dehydrogenase (NAD(P)+) [Pseudoroseicyclus aestuarii]